jgi:hypothetical protein
MGWKIYFVVMALLCVGGLKDLAHPASMTIVAWLNWPVSLASLLGLYGYAFRQDMLTPAVWRVVAGASIVMLFADFGQMWVTKSHEQIPGGPIAVVIAVVVVLLITVPNIYALFRYADRLADASEGAVAA